MICFLEVVHSDIFYSSNIYWNIVLHEKQENNFVSSCESKTHLFLFLGVGKEGSVFVINKLQKYEFYLMYFLIVS